MLIKSSGGTGPVKLRQPIFLDKVPIPRDETFNKVSARGITSGFWFAKSKI